MNSLERRFTKSDIELKAIDDDETKAAKIVGYGAKFNSRSENLGGFTEIIAEGAFDDVLENDVRALFNHDENIVLGRTISGTLGLSVDDTGLRYEIDPPDTQLVRDMVISPMRRGDIDQSSFGFYIGEDDWKEDRSSGAVTRTILKVERLLDVSPVTYPAYPDTSVAMRKLQELTDKNIIELPDEDVVAMLVSASKVLGESTNHRTLLAVIDKAQEEIRSLRRADERQKGAIALLRQFGVSA